MRWTILVCALSYSLVACSSSGGDATDAGSNADGSKQADNTKQDVAVQFRMLVGDKPVTCGGSYEGLGTDNFKLVTSDARMYVMDVKLLQKDGTELPVTLDADGQWQQANLALLDFEDGGSACPFGTTEMNDTLRGQADAGDFTGLRFTVGVPFDLNHQDQATAAAPLNVTSLFWSWQGGYKFLRVDGVINDSPDTPLFMHLGSTGCVGGEGGQPVTSCKHENTVEVTIDGFDPTTQAVALDLAKLFSQTKSTAAQCLGKHDDPACQGPLTHLGLLGGGAPDVFQPAAKVASLGGP